MGKRRIKRRRKKEKGWDKMEGKEEAGKRKCKKESSEKEVRKMEQEKEVEGKKGFRKQE